MSAYVNTKEPSVVIEGRQKMIQLIESFVGGASDADVRSLTDVLLGNNYMSDLFYEEAAEQLKADLA